MIIFLLTLFIIDIILLIPTILLQANGADSGILSSNLTSGAFGAKSNEILVKFTTYLVTIFIGLALVLSIHFIRINNVSGNNMNTRIESSIEDGEINSTELV